MDPFQVLQTAIAPSLDAIKTGADRNFAMAVRSNDQAREDAKIQSDRLYHERLLERERQQKKSDEAEARKRTLRNQLASLMPAGSEINTNLSEEELSAQISNRTRARTIEWDKEDKERALNFEMDKASKLSEEQLKREAEKFGVPFDPSNKNEVQKAVALSAAKQKLEIDASMAQQRISQAKSLPEYNSVKKRLADAIYERNMVAAAMAFPEPTFNPAISPQDRADIYNEMSRMPEVTSLFSKYKDGAMRLMALNRGDFETAVKGIPENERMLMVDALSKNSDKLEERLLKDRSMEYQGGVKSYVERLRTLPQRLSEIDRRIESIYKIGDGTGIDIGNALRMEDPDSLLQEYHDDARAGALKFPQLGGQSQPSTQTAGALPLPAPGQVQSSGRRSVPGIIPQAWNSVSNFGGDILRDPLASEGLSQLVGGVSQNMDAIGSGVRDSWVNLFGGELSSKNPAPNITDVLQGTAKTAMYPFSVLGRTMRKMAPIGDDPDISSVPPFANPQH